MKKIIITGTLLFINNNYGMLKITSSSSRIKHSAKTPQSRHFMPFNVNEISLEAFNTIYQLKAENHFLKKQLEEKNFLLSQHNIKPQTVTEEMILFRSRDQHRTNEE